MTCALGLDIGATTLCCAVAGADGACLGRASRPTPRGPTADAFTDGIRATIADTLADAGVPPARVERAGVASVGPLDVAAGLIRGPANLESDLTIPVRPAVQSCLPDATVLLCNDATAGAIAEREAGAAENLVYVTLSTGVGAGVVVDGHVLWGEEGNAAEVGHVTLDPDASRRCGCGGRGHWEAFAGGENIPDYAAELADTGGFDDTLLAGECTAATVFGAYGEEPLATETVQRVGEWNAQGMAMLVHAFAPRRIAVGGAVACNNERLVLEPIRERIGRYLMDEPPDIGLTAFGEEAVLRGALLLAAGGGHPGAGTPGHGGGSPGGNDTEE